LEKFAKNKFGFKMKLILTILIIIPLTTFGQPGGDGGVNILKLFDNQLNQLELDTHKIKVNVFSLPSDNISKRPSKRVKYELSYKCPDSNYWWGKYEFNPIDSLLPFQCNNTPYFSLNLMTKNYNINNKENENQRLEIKVNTQTMIIDFLKIIPPTGMGTELTIDSLVFSEGHFIYDIEKSVDQKIYRYNITPSSMFFLKKYGIIRQEGEK
jgi:hypothetical protein